MDEQKKEQKPVSTNSDSNLMGALSYVWILSVVMLIIKKDDEFVKFHAKQGLVLFIASFIGVVPVIGWAIWLVVVVLDIVGFIKALSGEKYKVPIVGDIANKISL